MKVCLRAWRRVLLVGKNPILLHIPMLRSILRHITLNVCMHAKGAVNKHFLALYLLQISTCSVHPYITSIAELAIVSRRVEKALIPEG